MKVWQEEIRVNGTIDELCQLMDDLISRHERKIYDYDMERTEGDSLYVRFITPPGFIPHDPAYDPTQHPPSGISAFSRGGQTFLRVQPDEYGYWDELYQALQHYGWLDEQPAETSEADNSGHYNHSYKKRRVIVTEYRKAREAGEVDNKDAWAQTNYQITGRTLLNYEREFPPET